MTAQDAREAKLTAPCSRCGGSGEIQECARDGKGGDCSHVWDIPRTCPRCDGNG